MMLFLRAVRSLLFIATVPPALLAADPPLLDADERVFLDGTAADFVSGDFDGDGRVDQVLAVSPSSGTQWLATLRGDGFGGFSTLTSPLIVLPGRLTAADFDNDGFLDLFVTGASGTLCGSVKNAGNGTFVDSGWLGYFGEVAAIEASDLDLDGVVDVVIATPAFALQPDGITVLQINTALAFDVAASLPETVATSQLEIVDLDQDGLPDLASLQPSISSLQIRRNLGSLAFTPATQYATGSNPSDLIALDVKGDAQLDLAVSNTGGNSLRIHAVQPGGTLSAPTTISTGVAPTALAAADLDRDGLDDIVVMTKVGAYVHRGSPTGIENSGTPQRVLTGSPRISIAYLNGDLAPDLLGTDGGTHAARSLGDGLGGFQRGHSFGTPAASVGSEFDLELADVDGDGDLDSFELLASPLIGIRTNLGAGQFSHTTTSVGFTFTGSNVHTFHAPDLNSDGRADLIATSGNGTAIRLGFGNGSFGGQTTYPPTAGAYQRDLSAGDFDNDGDLDMVIGELVTSPAKLILRWNNGTGAMPTSTLLSTGTSSSNSLDDPVVAAGDFDQDGLTDIAAIDASLAKRAKLFRNLGGGSFSQQQTATTTVRGEHIASGDVDHDGDDDLVTSRAGNVGQNVPGNFLRSDGVQFSPFTALPFKLGSSAFAATYVTDVALADIDGDGNGDLLFNGLDHQSFSWDGTYEIIVRMSHGDGTFAPPRSFATQTRAQAIAAADLDGDGRAEIAALGDPSGPTLPGSVNFAIVSQRCAGAQGRYGTGCVGSGGFVPELGFGGCPTAGGMGSIEIERALGGSTALLFLGLTEAQLPVSASCQLLTAPVLPPLALPLAGSGPGTGSLTLSVPLPMGLGAFEFRMQAFVLDAGVALGASATRGVIVSVDG